MIAILVALLIPTVAPPANAEASRAVSRAIAAESGVDIDANPVLPAEVTLDRCERTLSRAAYAPDGFLRMLEGHSCIISVVKLGEPTFKVRGFFAHDGYQWTWYGPTRAPEFAGVGAFDETFRPAPLTPKEGAVRYEGLTGLFESHDPYAAILGDTAQDGFDRPYPDLTTAPRTQAPRR